MSHGLTEEQRMLVDSVRSLAESEFQDKAFEWEGDFPRENLRLLAERGFLGVNLDEAYGGGGMSEYEAILMVEAIGRVCPDTAMAVIDQQMVAPRAIDMFGTESAKEGYLPPVIGGEDCIAIAISEPEAGSDVRSMNTTVREEGGNLVLNGEKIWVTKVPYSSAAVVWTKFPEGLGSVVVEFGWEGVEVAQHFTNMAGDPQTQFYMNDVVVPEENVLLRGDDAFKEQLKALNWERIASATIAYTQALCAFEKALEYAGDREQFGQPIEDFQGVEWELADMATELQAMRAMIHGTAQDAYDRGRVPDPFRALSAKLFAATRAESIVSEALQIHGANGYQRGHPVEKLYRDVRGRRIAAGTDAIHRNQIASILKESGFP